MSAAGVPLAGPAVYFPDDEDPRVFPALSVTPGAWNGWARAVMSPEQYGALVDYVSAADPDNPEPWEGLERPDGSWLVDGLMLEPWEGAGVDPCADPDPWGRG